MSGLRVICTGLIGSIPMAGLTMHYLQYVLGLRQLGHEVLYLEDTGAWNYDPNTDSMTDDVNLPVAYLRNVMSAHGLADYWAFIDHWGQAHGLTQRGLQDFVRTADIFINVTGAGILRESYLDVPCRLYIDTDPGYIQMRVAGGNQQDIYHLTRHTHHFSFGCNIGKPGCGIPPGEFDWLPTCQPVVKELWPVVPGPGGTRKFTTVLKWQSYDPVEYDGETYGLKNEEFVKFIDLPERVACGIELAMAGNPPVSDLEGRGWLVRNARSISDTIEHYQRFIQGSKAEWSIAKNGYVKTNSGWFSDRSASYLASGRPVALQSTGYEEWLETGAGLLSFRTVAEAVGAIDEICCNYEAHCKAASALAHDVFRADKVIDSLIERAGL